MSTFGIRIALAWMLALIVACMGADRANAGSYGDGLREVSARIGGSLESRRAQVGTVLDLNGLDGSVTQLGKLVAQGNQRIWSATSSSFEQFALTFSLPA